MATHKHRLRDKAAGAPRHNAGQQEARSAHEKGDCHQEKEECRHANVVLGIEVKGDQNDGHNSQNLYMKSY